MTCTIQAARPVDFGTVLPVESAGLSARPAISGRTSGPGRPDGFFDSDFALPDWPFWFTEQFFFDSGQRLGFGAARSAGPPDLDFSLRPCRIVCQCAVFDSDFALPDWPFWFTEQFFSDSGQRLGFGAARNAGPPDLALHSACVGFFTGIESVFYLDSLGLSRISAD